MEHLSRAWSFGKSETSRYLGDGRRIETRSLTCWSSLVEKMRGFEFVPIIISSSPNIAMKA